MVDSAGITTTGLFDASVPIIGCVIVTGCVPTGASNTASSADETSSAKSRVTLNKFSTSKRNASSPPSAYPSASLLGASPLATSAAAPTGTEIMVPPLPPGATASNAIAVSSLFAFTTASKFTFVCGMSTTTPWSTLSPPDSFNNEFAPTTMPLGNAITVRTEDTTAAIMRRRRRAGIAVMTSPHIDGAAR